MLDLLDIIRIKYTMWKAEICGYAMRSIGYGKCSGRIYEKSLFGKVIKSDTYARCKLCRMYNRREIR